MRFIRVFVSSPGDAEHERKRVVRVMERLNAAFAGTAQFKPVLWEERYYSAHDGFQQQIERSTDCDIVVAILRGRLGTPLPSDFMARLPPEDRLPDAASYQSGTAYEILSAIAARQRGAALPDIFVFRYPHNPVVGLDDENRTDIEAQWQKLKSFAERVFVSAEGHFRGAYQTFSSTDEFETQAEGALLQWLSENVLKDRAVIWPISIKGSPFRGLEPFGAKHAEVFYGRDGDRGRALDRLKDASDAGFPFLAIIGPSGAGKSSFARAGILPWLVKPGAVTGVGVWRTAVMRPSDHPNSAIASLARHLFDDEKDIAEPETSRPVALPELASGDSTTPQALAGLFSVFARGKFERADDLENAGRVAMAPIEKALKTVAEAERKAWSSEKEAPARLLLVIDQFDELFAPGVDDAARAAFARLIERMARSGLVWIVATLRAEFYETFLKSPLARLASPETSDANKRLELTFDLLPPGLPETAEIVRGPARAAGLDWETDPASGERLDNRLLTDIDRPDLLPLVQFVLEQLYEQRVRKDETDTLTFDAYRALGTLDGAIDKAAEKALSQLGPAEQAALPRLLRALVTYARPVSGGGKSAVALVQAARKTAAYDEVSTRLVDALTEARILVSGNDQDKAPTIALAHQRVIEAWQRAQKIVAESEGLLRIRDEVEEARRRWTDSGQRRDLLIPAGLPLSEAENAASTLGDELPVETQGYIQRSGRAARLRKTLAAAAMMAILAFAVLAGFEWRQEGEARKAAIEQRDTALLAQSRYLTELSNQRTDAGNAGDGLLLALEALPDSDSKDEINRNKKVWPAAQFALDKAMRAYREKSILRGHEGRVIGIAVSPDGKRIVSSSADGTARVWDAESGASLVTLEGHTDSVISVAFTPDGSRIISGSRDHTARVWEANSGKELTILRGHTAEVHSVAVTPDGERIVTGAYDKTIRVWDARSGAELLVLKGHTRDIYGVAVTQDSARIVSGSNDGTVRVWDARTGAALATLKGPDGFILSVAVTPDGSRILAGGYDGPVWIWDADTGAKLGVLQGHTKGTFGIAVSADGSRIATGSFDNTIRLWDAKTGAVLAVFGVHDADVGCIAFTPDGLSIVSGLGDRTIRVWDAKIGDEIRTLRGHSHLVRAVVAAPDNIHVFTGSIQGGDGTIRAWDIRTGTLVGVLKGHTAGVQGLALSKDGKLLVSGSEDKTARVWDVETSRELIALRGHTGTVFDVAFMPDGSRVVTGSGSGDNTARIWDVRAGTELVILKGHTAPIWCVAVTPDGSRVLTGSGDKTVRVWDANTGAELLRIFVSDSPIWSVAVTPDGSRIVTGSVDGTTRISDARTGDELLVLKGNGEQVIGVAVTPDGSRIVTGSADHIVRVWDARDGTLLTQLRGHTDKVWRVAVTPDGAHIITGSEDATAKVWENLPSGQALVERAKQRVQSCFTPEQRTKLSLSAAPDEWCGHLAKWPYDSTGALVEGIRRILERDDSAASTIFAAAEAAHPEITPKINNAWRNAYCIRGYTLLEQGDDQQAATQFDLAIARDPQSKTQIESRWAEALAVRGAKLLKQGKIDLALEQFSAAIARNPAITGKIDDLRARAYLSRGLTAAQEGRDRDAKTQFDEAIALAPNAVPNVDRMWALAYLARGKRLFVEGKDQEAREQWSMAIARQPEIASEAEKAWTDSLISRGLKQFENDVHQETNSSLDQALQRDPDAAERINVAKAMTYLGRARTLLDGQPAAAEDGAAVVDDAIALLRKSLQLIPIDKAQNEKRGIVILHLGRAFFRKQLLSEAIEKFREAESLGNEDAGGWLRHARQDLAAADYKDKRFEEAFLIGARAYIDSDPSLKGTSLSRELFWSFAELYRTTRATPRPADITECDRLASDRLDPMGVGTGVPVDKLDQSAAIIACARAIKENPGGARLRFNLARAYSRAADLSRLEKNEQKANEADSASLSELERVVAQGYPWAFIYAATNYIMGRGTEIDVARGNDYILQGFAHMLYCCWVPVARHLLTEEQNQQPGLVRGVVSDMTDWAARLGNVEAIALFAELNGSDVANVTASLPKVNFAAPPSWFKSRRQTRDRYGP